MDKERNLFHCGDNYNSYRFLGAHPIYEDDTKTVCKGINFAVWAPEAEEIKVVGDFNDWGKSSDPIGSCFMHRQEDGIWEIFVPWLSVGTTYKYSIKAKDGSIVLKADPYAFSTELRPGTASVVSEIGNYNWNDAQWICDRKQIDYISSPISIYELHLGSWRRNDGNMMNYKEIADELCVYLEYMNYTHVEVMPLMEHPFDGSWGYQIQSFFSITSRYGTPQDFMYFVDKMHQKGIGVIMDWVPVHFCKDISGLYKFDGSWLYEYNDESRRENRLWGTALFDLTKGEVQSFLLSSAAFYMDVYHVDGIRVDAVANLIYIGHGTPECGSVRNQYGGLENIEGIQFMKKLNKVMYTLFDNPLMIAEDSSAWPLVTRPDYIGGLGFTFKWNMGWMNDTLKYVDVDPIFRKWHHGKMTFSLSYVFSENYILPISHDEVVHGKKSLLNKFPGNYDEKFAGMRCYLTYMMGHPGKKLLFMGCDFGEFIEWRYYEQLEWHLTGYHKHKGIQEFVRDINYLYRQEKALWELDCREETFEWIDAGNSDQNIFTFIRKSADPKDFLVFVMNFSPVAYEKYKLGVSRFADYVEIFNSDDTKYGGSGNINPNPIRPLPSGWNGRTFSIELNLPSNGAVIFKPRFRK